MQKHFHILLGLNITDIKKDLWRDMGEKLTLWRHELKKPLAIQADETPNLVMARARVTLYKYNPMDVDILLAKWYEKKNQVG
jgi:hypothetical protein